MKKEDITLEDIRRRMTKVRDVYKASSQTDEEILEEARRCYRELQESINK